MMIIRTHLDHLAFRGQRPTTIRARRWCLLRLYRWVDSTSLLTATPEEVYAFCARPVAADARANTVSHVKAFYLWAHTAGLLDTDPSAAIERPRRPRRYPRPMPEHELRLALSCADQPIRTWLYLAAFGGLRCCEIAPLRGEDRRGQVLMIREQKGGDEGSIAIGPVLDQALAHLPRKGWWFERWDGVGGPISAGQLQRHANRFLHNLGIENTMHTLRHRYVTLTLRAAGGNIRIAQEAARHRSIASTALYAHVDPDDVRAAISQLVEPA